MKLSHLVALAIATFPLIASADTVNITYVQTFKEPASNQQTTLSYAFKGTRQIVVQIFNKTCTWVGSATAIGPKGCNYWIGADTSSIQLKAIGTDSNPQCTPLEQLVPNCR